MAGLNEFAVENGAWGNDGRGADGWGNHGWGNHGWGNHKGCPYVGWSGGSNRK